MFTGASFGGRTAPEIASIAGEAGSTLVIPVGSVEQHGHHLPVATDTMLVDAVVRESVDRMDDVPVLVAPPLWVGYSPHHLPFGGTLSGDFETLLPLLEQIASTGLRDGFEVVCPVNGHGGNKPLVEAAVSEIGAEHPATEVVAVTYFELPADDISDLRESDAGGMAHGGEFETSLMLHCFSEHVREDRPSEYGQEEYEEGAVDLVGGRPLTVYRSFDEYSESGAIGDTSLATAEQGDRLFDAAVEALQRCLTEVHENSR